MDTRVRGSVLTRSAQRALALCVTGFCAAVITGAVTWLLPAIGARAAGTRAYFTVSVQVVGHCSLDDPGALLPAGELVLSCTRGTGYQILVDGHPASVGADGDVVKILPLSKLSAPATSRTQVPQVHWLTILY